MKAISLWQPWASAVIHGSKQFETRSWKAPEFLIGKRIAIHAAKKTTWKSSEYRDWFDELESKFGCKKLWGESIYELPLGCLLGHARLVDCVETKSIFHEAKPINLDVWQSLSATVTGHEFSLGDFSPGRWAWRLDDVVEFDEPMFYRGAQGFFEVPFDFNIGAEI